MCSTHTFGVDLAVLEHLVGVLGIVTVVSSLDAERTQSMWRTKRWKNMTKSSSMSIDHLDCNRLPSNSPNSYLSREID
jgi:hypothetical protein